MYWKVETPVHSTNTANTGQQQFQQRLLDRSIIYKKNSHNPNKYGYLIVDMLTHYC